MVDALNNILVAYPLSFGIGIVVGLVLGRRWEIVRRDRDE